MKKASFITLTPSLRQFPFTIRLHDDANQGSKIVSDSITRVYSSCSRYPPYCRHDRSLYLYREKTVFCGMYSVLAPRVSAYTSLTSLGTAVVDQSSGMRTYIVVSCIRNLLTYQLLLDFPEVNGLLRGKVLEF